MALDRKSIDKIELKHPVGNAKCSDLFEVPGYPQVVYQVRKYLGAEGVKQARQDVPYLFKSFETGYPSPAVLRRQKHKDQNRNFYTIHEYLDWTVSARPADDEVEVDFEGFRLVLLFHRLVRQYPAPPQYDPPHRQQGVAELSGPLAPMPQLLWEGKAISCATVRTGPGHMEMPFFATHDAKRGRGFGKVMLRVVEQMCRYLGVPRILLCSSNEAAIVGFWRHVGFEKTTCEAVEQLGINFHGLVHMQETVQMLKDTPPSRKLQSIVVRHHNFVRRVYREHPNQPAPPAKRSREGPSPALPQAKAAKAGDSAVVKNGVVKPRAKGAAPSPSHRGPAAHNGSTDKSPHVRAGGVKKAQGGPAGQSQQSMQQQQQQQQQRAAKGQQGQKRNTQQQQPVDRPSGQPFDLVPHHGQQALCVGQ